MKLRSSEKEWKEGRIEDSSERSWIMDIDYGSTIIIYIEFYSPTKKFDFIYVVKSQNVPFHKKE